MAKTNCVGGGEKPICRVCREERRSTAFRNRGGVRRNWWFVLMRGGAIDRRGGSITKKTPESPERKLGKQLAATNPPSTQNKGKRSKRGRKGTTKVDRMGGGKVSNRPRPLDAKEREKRLKSRKKHVRWFSKQKDRGERSGVYSLKKEGPKKR